MSHYSPFPDGAVTINIQNILQNLTDFKTLKNLLIF